MDRIETIGVDLDYTVSSYSTKLQELVYNLARTCACAAVCALPVSHRGASRAVSGGCRVGVGVGVAR
jgi:hypothetical protein